jgi:hypothetical protein
MTNRDWIDLIMIPTEDYSLQPQAAQAATPMLIYDYLTIAKNSVVYQLEDAKQAGALADIDSIWIPCVKLKKLDKNECPCNPSSGCYWFRTVDPLPEMHGDVIAVATTKIDKKIQYTAWDDIEDNKDSYSPLFNTAKSYTFRRSIDGLHLYLDYPIEFDLERVAVQARFNNYEDLLKYADCDDSLDSNRMCDIMDQEFVAKEQYKMQIIQSAIALINGFFSVGRVTDSMTDEVDGSRDFANVQ